MLYRNLRAICAHIVGGVRPQLLMQSDASESGEKIRSDRTLIGRLPSSIYKPLQTGQTMINQSDYDFSYLKTLSKEVQLAAAVYEHARSSEPILEGVAQLHQAQVYDLDFHIEEIGQNAERTLLEVIRSLSAAFDTAQIYWLGMWLHRDRPFSKLTDTEVAEQFAHAAGFTRGLHQLNWPKVAMLQKLQSIDPELEVLTDKIVLSIPWEFTDDELVKMFRELLPKLRPDSRPAPRKAGRKGRGRGFRAVDVLNQLGAWRLEKAGISQSQAVALGFSAYKHQESWRKAVKAAESRIDTLLTVPFWKS